MTPEEQKQIEELGCETDTLKTFEELQEYLVEGTELFCHDGKIEFGFKPNIVKIVNIGRNLPRFVYADCSVLWNGVEFNVKVKYERQIFEILGSGEGSLAVVQYHPTLIDSRIDREELEFRQRYPHI